MALRFAVGYGQCCQSKFPKFPAADCQKSESISKKKKKRSWIFTTVLTSSDLLKSRFATQLSCISIEFLHQKILRIGCISSIRNYVRNLAKPKMHDSSCKMKKLEKSLRFITIFENLPTHNQNPVRIAGSI